MPVSLRPSLGSEATSIFYIRAAPGKIVLELWRCDGLLFGPFRVAPERARSLYLRGGSFLSLALDAFLIASARNREKAGARITNSLRFPFWEPNVLDGGVVSE